MRLKELRINKKLTQEELSKEILIGRVNYNRYELEQVKPPIETLIKLADFYKVSVDYILGHDTNFINIDDLNLLQRNLIKKIIKCDDLTCTRLDAYLSGMLDNK